MRVACLQGDSGARLRLERWVALASRGRQQLDAGAGGAPEGRADSCGKEAAGGSFSCASPDPRLRLRRVSERPEAGSTRVSSPLADQAARDLAVASSRSGRARGRRRHREDALAGGPPRDLAPRPRLGGRRRGARGAAPPPGRPAAEPDEIAARVAEGTVAITFTDAAAAEMSRRLGELLGELAGGPPARDLAPLPPLLAEVDLVERAHRLAAVLSRLRLQTIHGFCHRLLADHPFEAGLHPTLAVDADGTAVAATATEVLIEALRTRQPQIAAVVREGVSPSELHAALVKLIAGGARKEDFARDRFDDATCAALLAEVAEPLGRFLPELERLAAAAASRETLPPALEALRGLERASTPAAATTAPPRALCEGAPRRARTGEAVRALRQGGAQGDRGALLGAGGASYLAWPAPAASVSPISSRSTCAASSSPGRRSARSSSRSATAWSAPAC